MAKKTATKSKAASSKVKNATKSSQKSSKPAAKPILKVASKKAVPAKKAAPVKKALAGKKMMPVKVLKPVIKTAVKEKIKSPQISASSAMTAKGKAEQSEPEEKVPAVKPQTVISMMEDSSGGEDLAKAEKISKVKPVKIERGNVADEKAKWAELYKKYGKEKAITYKMSEIFTTMIPIQHKVLGWGFVLTNENDRLEVLFETGIRMLISNYKA